MRYLYKYRDDLYKLVTIYDREKKWSSEPWRYIHEEKTADNIRRAQRSIEDYALCNDWDFFVTLTLDGKKVKSRQDLDGWRAELSQWLRNHYPGCRYLLVPELHKKGGAWHMHGLFGAQIVEGLQLFDLDQHLPYYIRDKLKTGCPVWDWPAYRERWGFVDVERVRNRDAAARYISKYVTKGISGTAKHIAKGSHLYYCSNGLCKPERVESWHDSNPLLEAHQLTGLVTVDSFPICLNSDDESDEMQIGTVEWMRPEDILSARQ